MSFLKKLPERKALLEWFFLAIVLSLCIAYFSFPEKAEGLARVFLWFKSLAKTILLSGS